MLASDRYISRCPTAIAALWSRRAERAPVEGAPPPPAGHSPLVSLVLALAVPATAEIRVRFGGANGRGGGLVYDLEEGKQREQGEMGE